MRKTIEKSCLHCNKTFTATYSEHKRGNAKYCDKSCARSAKRGKRTVKTLTNNCVCSYCNKQFYRGKTKREISKSGLQFCSRVCKDHGQRIENNLTEVWPDHYKTGNGACTYRPRALRTFAHVCMVCGYNKQPEILEVHHKDHNRANNATDNLEVLCPNCHSEHHFASKTGKWAGQKDNSVAA